MTCIDHFDSISISTRCLLGCPLDWWGGLLLAFSSVRKPEETAQLLVEASRKVLLQLVTLVEFPHDVRCNLLLVFSNISISFAKIFVTQLIGTSISNRNIQDSNSHPQLLMYKKDVSINFIVKNSYFIYRQNRNTLRVVWWFDHTIYICLQIENCMI